ncbi:PIR Superfamily Protein [Plasmodium ovale curtisi]|uniref:PIR Superfamily Protein n=1 Tax=Plasmodium ovale curtisi TaxID=864141 RepID=A0A1A8WGS2_PLAOA|nr:PIR Superfamily Protein [Plasmodium ovale curtisi]
MPDTDYDISNLNSNVCYRKLDRAPDVFIDRNEQFWNDYVKNACIKDTKMFNSLLKAFYYVAYLEKYDEIFYDDRWNYLYFWVGNKAIENTKEKCTFEEVMSILNSVKLHIHKSGYDYDITEIKTDYFKYLKVVYDYFQNYNNIKLKIGLYTSDCTQSYKQHVEGSFDIYEKLKTECQRNEEKAHCKMLKYIIEKHGNKLLTKLTCLGNKPPFSVEDHRKQVLEEVDTEIYLEHSTQTSGAHKQVPTGEKSSSLSSDDMMSTFFPILGIFSILFLLYNFTPFRIWLHNILSKKEIIRHNDYEDESNEFFENEYESSDRNNQYKRYDINYHSITNL